MRVARRPDSCLHARILAAILAFAGVRRVDDVPVVNGLIALTEMAGMAVRVRRLTGVFTSKRMMRAPPSGTLLADIRAAYADHVYPGAT